MEKILCIEDDATIQALVAAALKDFDVFAARSLKEAASALAQQKFQALIVDIQLPDGDGLRFLTEFMGKAADTPVFVLTDHAGISNKVMAFSFGAEDFVAKPFDPVELHARVSSKIRKRKVHEEKSRHRRVGDLLIDLDRQKVFLVKEAQERDLQLTTIELRMLTLLTQRMEQVYSREQILDQIWGNTNVTDRTVDSHIAHLRQKIISSKVLIETVKSQGYRATVGA